MNSIQSSNQANEPKIEHYYLKETIGKGAMGKVKLAYHEYTNTKMAVKIINKRKMREKNMTTRINREIKFLRYFNHPNIIRLYEVLDTETDIFVFLEYAAMGDLQGLIIKQEKLTEDHARYLFRHFLAGIEFCHSNLVAHRDIKPGNILVDEFQMIKIADFGLSNLMRDGKFLRTDCGTPSYVAPEIVMRKKYCGTEIDTWSAGIVLYQMLAGICPFHDEIPKEVMKKILVGHYTMPDHFSPLAKDLISRMLQPNPLLRIRFHQIKNHPWFQNIAILYLDPRQIRSCLELKKIREESLQRTKSCNFNFANLNDKQIKEIIKRKQQQHSFVVGYNLIHDEIVKKKVMSKLADKDRGMLIEIKSEPLPIIKKTNASKTASTMRTKSQSLFKGDNWHYGFKYYVEGKTLVPALLDILTDSNIYYNFKKTGWKIYCTYQGGSLSEIGDDDLSTTTKSNKSKRSEGEDKYDKKSLSFKIHIFSLPDKSGHVVDFQRKKGHTLMFLNFCRKIGYGLQEYIKTLPNHSVSTSASSNGGYGNGYGNGHQEA